MKHYDAYLFDVDGTLIDTKPMIVASYLHLGEVVGVDVDRRLVLDTIGLPLRVQAEIVLGKGREAAYYDEAAVIYSRYMDRVYKDYIQLFPGAAECLAALRDLGKRLAIVTSRRRRSLDSFLDYLDVSGFFEVVVTPDDIPAHKPDPAPARLALERLGVEAAKSVFIGDAGFDVQCGNGAGTDTAFVAWGGNPVDGLPLRPDFVAETFADLLPIH